MAVANRLHLVVEASAHRLRNTRELDDFRANRAALIAGRELVLLQMLEARQHARVVLERVSPMYLVHVSPVAKLAVVAVFAASQPQLRLIVPVIWMLHEPADEVAHLNRGPIILAVRHTVVEANSEVAPGSVVLGSWPSSRAFPAIAVTVQG